MFDAYLSAFLLLFVVVDPLGNIPLFLAVMDHMPLKQMQRAVLVSVLVATLILAGFALAGTALLSYLGISFASFKVAGGLVLFKLALDMLSSKRQERRQSSVDSDEGSAPPESVVVFPLATPLLAGPSAIASVMVVISHNADDHRLQVAGALALVSVMVAAATILWLAAAARKWINAPVMAVLSRVMAIILAALSVQFVVDGLRELGLVPGL